MPNKNEIRKYVFDSEIKKRMTKNQNTIMVINGATGSGKTYGGLRLCEDFAKMFDTNFSIKDNVAFKFPDLLKKMRLKQNAVPKTPFLLEEVGAFGSGGSSREWQSQANKFFFSFLQTNRCKNQILVLTTPSFNYLEAGARNLVHIQLETKYINHKQKLCYFKPHFLDVNQRKGKIYFKFSRYRTPDGVRRKLNEVGLGLPSSHIVKAYELVKDKYVDDLNSTIIELTEEKPVDKKKNKEIEEEDILRDFKEDIKQVDIAKKRNLSTRQVRRYKKKFIDDGRLVIEPKSPRKTDF